MNSAIKRIISKDIKEINKLNLSETGIHIEFNENNMLNGETIRLDGALRLAPK